MIPQIPDDIQKLVQIQRDESPELTSVDKEVQRIALKWLNDHSQSIENSPLKDQLQSLREILQNNTRPKEVEKINALAQEKYSFFPGDVDLVSSEFLLAISDFTLAEKKIAFDWFEANQKDYELLVLLNINITSFQELLQQAALQYETLQNPSEFLQDWITVSESPHLNNLVTLFFQECTLLDYKQYLSDLLEKVPFERLVPIFLATFHQKDRLESMLPLLFEKIPPEQVIDFLQQRDVYNNFFFAQ